MELKEYQTGALDAFARWLDALEEARLRAETGIAALQDAGVDVPPDLRDYPRGRRGNGLARSRQRG